MTGYKPGDVVLVAYPFEERAGGRRPAPPRIGGQPSPVQRRYRRIGGSPDHQPNVRPTASGRLPDPGLEGCQIATCRDGPL
jgi:hypothetical protein